LAIGKLGLGLANVPPKLADILHLLTAPETRILVGAATYWPSRYDRFGLAPASPEDFHTPVPRGLDLEQIFRVETERTVNNDWVVRQDSRLLQVERRHRVHPPARSTVVCEYQGRPSRAAADGFSTACAAGTRKSVTDPDARRLRAATTARRAPSLAAGLAAPL
jgi:hypothetical protein